MQEKTNHRNNRYAMGTRSRIILDLLLACNGSWPRKILSQRKLVRAKMRFEIRDFVDTNVLLSKDRSCILSALLLGGQLNIQRAPLPRNHGWYGKSAHIHLSYTYVDHVCLAAHDLITVFVKIGMQQFENTDFTSLWKCIRFHKVWACD